MLPYGSKIYMQAMCITCACVVQTRFYSAATWFALFK